MDEQQGNTPERADERREGEHWEREVLAELAYAAVREQRRSRRWGIFFKSLGFLYLLVLLLVVMAPKLSGERVTHGKHTALVELSGVIAPDTPANAEDTIAALEAAFEDKNTQGVVLRINSPGGSPVQSGYIYDAIGRLREQYPDTPLYAVVGDICASGGYYVAAAADEIYANRASIVGSIGVRMGGFGFVEAIDKLGVERRLYTAGENKALNDPFLPEDPAQTEHLQSLLDAVHQQFIEAVETGRGERLEPVDGLYSGLIWTGRQGVDIGLVDGLGSLDYVAREVVGAERVVDFTREEDLLRRLSDRIESAVVGVATRLMSERVGVQASL